MKKILTVTLIFIGVFFVAKVIASDFDKILFVIMLVMTIGSLFVYKLRKLYFYASLLLLVISVLFYTLNSPYGDLIYYYEKASLWSFNMFTVGTIFSLLTDRKLL